MKKVNENLFILVKKN